MIEQYTVLDMVPGIGKPTVNVSQYDTGARVLIFRIQKRGQSFTPPAGTVAKIHGKKPDNNYFTYAAEIDGDTVIADCTEQMTPVAGITVCEIVLTNAAGQVGSCNFTLNVERSPVVGAVISDTDIPLFEQLAEAAAESAASSASSASDSAASATSAEESATSAANSATDAQTAAEQARESATASAGSAAQAQAAETGAEEFARNSATSAGESLAHMRDAQTAAGQAAASASAADTSAGNAAASASAAAESATAADTSADRAEQAAKDAGYMYFYIDDNGDLIYQRTSNTQVDFYLSDGDLYVRGVA